MGQCCSCLMTYMKKSCKGRKKRKVTLPMRIAPSPPPIPHAQSHISPPLSFFLFGCVYRDGSDPPFLIGEKGKTEKEAGVTRLPRVRLQYVSGGDDASLHPPPHSSFLPPPVSYAPANSFAKGRTGRKMGTAREVLLWCIPS